MITFQKPKYLLSTCCILASEFPPECLESQIKFWNCSIRVESEWNELVGSDSYLKVTIPNPS